MILSFTMPKYVDLCECLYKYTDQTKNPGFQ